MQSTRRLWLSQCVGIAALADIAAAQQHAHEAAQSSTPPAFQTLDPAMATEIDAITSQIIPSTDGPGAHEAGVIYFIDRALSTFDADLRESYRTGHGRSATEAQGNVPGLGQHRGARKRTADPIDPSDRERSEDQRFLRTAPYPHALRIPRQSELRRKSRQRRLEADRL